MNQILLLILDQFKWAFRAMQVDYGQLRAIVKIKLIMDNRRQGKSFSGKENSSSDYAFATTLLLYAVFGSFFAWLIFIIPSFTVGVILFFSYVLAMTTMTLITDFSSVILDTSDNTIILPRPVDSRTFYVARLTHIMIYVGLIGVALSISSSVVILLKYNIATFLLFIVVTILTVLTAVVITNALYLLTMQYASEEKLKSIINYTQIAIAVVMMAAYQLVPRMLGRFDLQEFDFEITWWSYLVPPVWMGSFLEAVHLGIFDLPHITMILFAIAFPIGGFMFVTKKLTPVFNKKLAALATDTSHKRNHKKSRTSFLTFLNRILPMSTIERGAFNLVYRISGRDRKLKLKIYPAYGYIIVFGLLFFISGNDEDIITKFQNASDSEYYFVLIYFSFMILQVALHEIPFSDDHKASWIFLSAPLSKPGDILSGMLKAIFIKLFLPGYIIISMIVIGVWGFAAFDDVIFGLLNNILMFYTLALINTKNLPLSLGPSLKTQSGNFVRSIVSLLVVGFIGVCHFLLTKLTSTVYPGIPVQLLLIYLCSRQYKRTTWQKITL